MDENIYPPKPEEIKIKPNPAKSFFSLILFIGAFHFFFDWGIATIAMVVGAVIIHELGHFLAMKFLKYEDLSIFFLPLLGAIATGKKEEVSQKQKIIVLLAGPLPGVIIGLLLVKNGIAAGNEMLANAGNIFLFLNLFNLLPIMPLDGGKITKTLFFNINDTINTVFVVASIIILAAFAVYTKSYIMLLLPLLLTMQLNGQSQIKKIRNRLISKGIEINTTYNNLPDRDYWLIRKELALSIKTYSHIINPSEYSISPFEARIIKQIKTIINKKPTQDLNLGGKILVITLWVSSLIIPFLELAYL